MSPAPIFGEPFGLAWLGFTIFALAIVVVAWFLITFFPWFMLILGFVTKMIRFVATIGAYPLRWITGKRKTGAKEIGKAGRSVFRK